MALVMLGLALVVGTTFWVWAAARAGGPRAGAVVAGVVLGWSALVSAACAAGVFPVSDEAPSPAMVPILVANLAGLALVISPFGGRLAAATPLWAAIGFQAFRVPVELMLWRLHAAGLVPEQMTFEGNNFDVVTGLLGLGIGLAWLGREVPRGVAWAFTAVGLALVLTIVGISIASFPGPLRVFPGEPHLLPVTAPWALLPMVLVPYATSGHALVIRRLLGAQKN